MEIKTILEMTKDWSEPGIADLLKLINLRRDQVTRIWDYCFGKQCTLFERDQTTLMIKEHGYDKVKQAFAEAGKQAEKGKHSLSYIQAVLKGMKQKEAIDKEKAFAALKAKEVALISGDKLREKTDLKPKEWVGFAKKTLGEEK